MNRRSVAIVDRERRTVATALVESFDAKYLGSVDTRSMPATFLILFEEFEDIVNNQVLSLLDQIEDRIGAIRPVAVFDDGSEAAVSDLQIYPGEGKISFKVAEPALLGDV